MPRGRSGAATRDRRATGRGHRVARSPRRAGRRDRHGQPANRRQALRPSRPHRRSRPRRFPSRSALRDRRRADSGDRWLSRSPRPRARARASCEPVERGRRARPRALARWEHRGRSRGVLRARAAGRSRRRREGLRPPLTALRALCRGDVGGRDASASMANRAGPRPRSSRRSPAGPEDGPGTACTRTISISVFASGRSAR